MESFGRKINGGSKGLWCDFGAGQGGLVSFLLDHGWDTYGIDPYSDGDLRGSVLAPAQRAKFDIVSSIEVIEHLVDPLPSLQRMADLLKPGGSLFVTTGRYKFRKNLLRWRYSSIPEVHVTFWSVGALSKALEMVGLEAQKAPKFSSTLAQAKILKHVQPQLIYRAAVSAQRAWLPLATLVGRFYGVGAHPIGWKPRSH